MHPNQHGIHHKPHHEDVHKVEPEKVEDGLESGSPNDSEGIGKPCGKKSNDAFSFTMNKVQEMCAEDFEANCHISDVRHNHHMHGSHHHHHDRHRKMMSSRYKSKLERGMEKSVDFVEFDPITEEMGMDINANNEPMERQDKIYGFGSRENDMCMLELRNAGNLQTPCAESMDQLGVMYQTYSFQSWPSSHHGMHGHHGMPGHHGMHSHHGQMGGPFHFMPFIAGMCLLAMAFVVVRRVRGSSNHDHNSTLPLSSTFSNMQSNLAGVQGRIQEGWTRMTRRPDNSRPTGLREPLIDESENNSINLEPNAPPIPHPHVDQYSEAMITQQSSDGTVMQAVL
mmetsp:Transcript_1742/g.2346  ORF Transcript_1742/g.2346 Transcript_1742/m.2346 type:complete len:339 (+) Transcript_1742:71-1087(+)|eukprot:CAMPEP_0117755378 /NCGR_PEP_ID=MMETSP0947-20121206/13414_1 /TAXON_ID=44440 /ORGANISM="Chattonella subsalsa, Strain CCMP2191" /LENGTH=338 /DNA_ID=CAMNT_0005574697 /DNA_START=33 /DNA_END=1049 /DNA_ORIENTATION=+